MKTFRRLLSKRQNTFANALTPNTYPTNFWTGEKDTISIFVVIIQLRFMSQLCPTGCRIDKKQPRHFESAAIRIPPTILTALSRHPPVLRMSVDNSAWLIYGVGSPNQAQHCLNPVIKRELNITSCDCCDLMEWLWSGICNITTSVHIYFARAARLAFCEEQKRWALLKTFFSLPPWI